MYPEEYVQPIREELTRMGFQELRTASEVDAVLGKKADTVLVVVNSICGCAAGRARPAVAMAIENKARPEGSGHGVCRPGCRRDQPGAQLLYRLPALIAFRRFIAGRQSGVHAGTERH